MVAPRVEIHAANLHREAVIIDGHSDILIPIADGKVRINDSVRVPEAADWLPPLGMPGGPFSQTDRLWAHALMYGPMGQYSLPQLLAGGVTVQACAIYVEDSHLDAALPRGLTMAWHLHREIEANKGLELVTSASDIRRVKREGLCGALLTFEGLEPLGEEIRFLDLYHKLGLRMASLTHTRRNLFADGVQPETKTGGLSALGRQAIQRMNELGIVIDLVHISEEGFWEILELTREPVVLSHSTPTMFPAIGPRAEGPLTDLARPGLVLSRDRVRLEAIAQNGGVLGIISFYQRDLEDVVADIELGLEAMGSDHVGLGSDYYGLGLAPKGLENISLLPALTRHLVQRGHSDEVILKILGGNYLRVFERVWGS